MAPPWSCTVCGRDYESVVRWRQRTGRRALQTRYPTCGRPKCRRAYQESLRDERLSYYRHRYERAKRGHRWAAPPSGRWRCAICGAGVEQALASRRRRGVRVLHTKSFRTCGEPECCRAWRLRYSRTLWGTRSDT